MTRTQLQLPDRIYGRAKNYADMREISMAELFRNAIEMYVMVHTADEPIVQAGSTWTPPVCRKTGLKTDPFADENWSLFENETGTCGLFPCLVAA